MKTDVLIIDEGNDSNIAVAQAVDALLSGKLVVFPTETVYGVAVCADSGLALASLSELKERPDNKPFTLHVGSHSAIDRYVPCLGLLNQGFLRKALPGPLTVVFDIDENQFQNICSSFDNKLIENLYFNNSIGIRLPENLITCKILNAVKTPVVASSANLAGQKPPVTAKEAIEQLDGKVDLIIDDGPTKYAKASTVVRLKKENIEQLRAGVIESRIIERMKQINILFVCTGNTCRSPMAEGIGRSITAKNLGCAIDQLEKKGYKFSSAGTATFNGASASLEAVDVCRELGIDISDHESRTLTANMINDADFIFAMAQSHYQAVLSAVSQAERKTALLVDAGIADPIGASIDVYRRCADQISAGFEKRLRNGLQK